MIRLLPACFCPVLFQQFNKNTIFKSAVNQLIAAWLRQAGASKGICEILYFVRES